MWVRTRRSARDARSIAPRSSTRSCSLAVRSATSTCAWSHRCWDATSRSPAMTASRARTGSWSETTLRSLSSKWLLAPEHRDRIAVEVGDRDVALGLVQALGVALPGPSVKPGDLVAELASLVLEGVQQLTGDTAAARGGDHVHLLDLADPVIEALHAPAADRLAVDPAHQEGA